jgi:hypothetical protein
MKGLKGEVKLTKYSKTSVVAMAAVMLLGIISTPSQGTTIFSDSFENPDTTGRVTNSPAGWGSTRSDKTGINDASVVGKTGSQYAYVDDYPNTGLFDGALTTTSEILGSNLTAWVNYTLTCDVTVSGAGGVGAIDLLAGTNVIASVTNAPATANDFSVSHALETMTSSAKISIIPTNSHPYLGQTLAIRLRKVAGAWNADVLFDNLRLDAVDTSSDTNAPTPNTMLWHSGPVASANTSITMTATNATDDNLVQYFFTNTVNGNVSGWICFPVWTDTGLTDGVTYSYKVKARDNSSNHNETAWSDEASATASSSVLLYESFEAPVHADVTSAFATNSQGWVYSTTLSGNAGLHDEASGKFVTPYGSQAAFVYDNSGTLNTRYTITNTAAVLEEGTQYALSFNAAAENNGPAGYGVDLLAGTNVVATESGTPGTNKIAATSRTITFTPAPGNPHLGQTIGVRLRKPTGGWSTGHIIYDNIQLSASSTSSDVSAPTPNPSTWLVEPVSVAGNSISMIATTASDPNGVEYFFTNTVNGHCSGWQASPGWTDTGLTDGATYTYKVKTRDCSSNLNEADWSAEKIATANSDILLYESFESPPHADVIATKAGDSQGWVPSGTGTAGLHDEASGTFTTPYGSQAAYVYDNAGSLGTKYTFTSTAAVLEVGTQYVLSFNTAAENNGSAGYGVDLLAGTNVVATASGTPGTNNVAATSETIIFTPASDNPYLGQAIGVRLRKPTGGWSGGHIIYDNVLLAASDTASDVTAPTPDPVVWHEAPVVIDGDSISMIARTASDPNGVQYFFTNTVNGHVSGWQNSRGWIDAGLSAYQGYSYKFKVRDNSSNLNESDWSSTLSVTMVPGTIFYDSFESPWHADVDARTSMNSAGWVRTGTDDAGLTDIAEARFTTPYGTQAAYVYDNGNTLGHSYTTAGITEVLEAGMTYGLSFNVAAEDGGTAGYGVDLMAGTNVLATATGAPGSVAISATSVTINFTTATDNPYIGDTLAIRLRKPDGAWNTGQILYDNVRLTALPTGFSPGSEDGGVAYDFVASPLETTVDGYLGYLNAMTNNELSVVDGGVSLASTSNLLCLTTNAEPDAYVAYDPGATMGSRFSAVPGRGDHPMIFVTWFGAAAYCNWKSTADGFSAVYNPANGWASSPGNSGYRLPTEAEWYKAAAWNAASGTFYAYGTASDTISTNDANFLNSGDVFEGNAIRTTPVGSYAAVSPYALSDMSGNVGEWCGDLYSGNDHDMDPHTILGGGWGHPAGRCKTTVRSALKPGQPADSVGFRTFRTVIWE